MTQAIKRGLAAAGVLALTATSAMADLPAGVSAAVTDAGTDGSTLLGLLAVAGAGVYLLAKVLGRFGIKL